MGRDGKGECPPCSEELTKQSPAPEGEQGAGYSSPSSPAVATNGHAASRLFSAGSGGSDSNDGSSHIASSRRGGQEFHGRRDLSYGQGPSQAVGTAGEVVGGQRSMLLWFEPFETPDVSPDDVLRFTTTAASSIARWVARGEV